MNPFSQLSSALQDPLRRRVLKNLRGTMAHWLQAGEPRCTLRPLPGEDWLCPFCAAHVRTPTWNGQALALLDDLAVVRHLDKCPGIRAGFKIPDLLPWEKLLGELLRMRAQHWPNYQLANLDGHWICPYCLDDTGILRRHWDGSESEESWWLPKVLEHLAACEACRRAPLRPHGVEEILAEHEPHVLRIRLLQRVEHEAIFKVFDERDDWIDPFSLQPVPTINRSRVPWDEGLQDAIVAHLLSPACSGRQTHWRTDVSLEVLYRVACESGASLDIERLHPAEPLRVPGTNPLAAERRTHALLDLDAARDLQVRMLPSRSPQIPGYEVSAYYDACEMLAGDLFQFIDAGEHRTGFLVADVSGHGPDAALLMAAMLKAFAHFAEDNPSPADVLARVAEDMLPDLPKGKFVTAFYAILDHRTAELRYVRAGHTPAYLADPANGTIFELSESGLALGIGGPRLFASRLQEGLACFTPGAAMLLYTDGISEAHNAADEPFGEERLKDLFLKHAGLSSRRAVEVIVEEVRKHRGYADMEDDLTLVALRRLPE